MNSEVAYASLESHTNGRLDSPEGERQKAGEKSDSIFMIWQKVQLDKQQLFLGFCSEEMNNIYGLINCMLQNERGHQRAR